jgi:predicted permease
VPLPEIRPGVRRLFRWPARRPDDVRAEVDDEIRLHLELRAEQLVARGLPPEQARAEAERRFGRIDEARARLHASAARREGRRRLRDAADALGRDLRLALRGLRRAPGFAAVAVLSLALGVGANTAVFSLINAVMLRSLPVRDPGRLVALGEDARGAGVYTNPIWEALRDRLAGRRGPFDGLFAYAESRFNLADAGEERRVAGLLVSGGFFPTLGVPAALGRPLGPADDVRGCPAVAVVGHRFWRQTLGGDPGAVGRTLRLDGHPFRTVGVADPRFAGPEAGRDVHVYAPLCANALAGARSFLDARSTWTLRVVGRTAAGVTPGQVNAGLAAVAPAVFRATVPPDWPADLRRGYLAARLVAGPPLGTLSGLRATYARPLLVLLAIAGVVLVVACANVANLVLARSTARRRELALRVALGGGRGRLVRQLVVEGLVLAGAGAALGLAVAYGGSRLLVGLISTPQEAVRLDLAPDLRVLGFTAALGVGTALLFSFAPALPATRVAPQAALKLHGPGVVGRRRGGAGRLLVVGQLALSLALVSAAALLLGSFRALTTLDPGFRAEHVLVVRADLRVPPGEAARAAAVRRALLDGLRALPGVQHAAAAFTTPVAAAGWNGDIAAAGAPAPRPGAPDVFFNAVTDGYFAALSMPLAAGRALAAGDGPGAPRVAVVNETLARRYFPGRSPVGRTFRLVQPGPAGDPIQVVGVVRDAKYGSLREPAPPTAFFALDQDSTAGAEVSFVVRGAGAPERLAAGVRRVFGEAAPRATLQLTALDRQVAESLTRDRLLATLSGFFGALALLLAVVGLYGTVAYAVARRRGELGVRVALGAAPARVRRLVLGDVGRIVAAGLALGSLATLAAARLVAAFLYGLTPHDPATLAGAALALGAAAGVAGYLPARRAARADPVAALRGD